MVVHRSKVPASFSKVKTPRLFPEYFHISRKKTNTKIHKFLSALLRFVKLGINTYSFRVGGMFFFFFFLTLTDPLRIQPWSQDRRNQPKSNRESEISMESRQKRTDKEVASKGHRRD